ncbi:MAG: hypothetical protein KC496_05355 [Anaerolineae bacterium]|nr:hypothetical protein [Anaerolineae bacterium]
MDNKSRMSMGAVVAIVVALGVGLGVSMNDYLLGFGIAIPIGVAIWAGTNNQRRDTTDES